MAFKWNKIVCESDKKKKKKKKKKYPQSSTRCKTISDEKKYFTVKLEILHALRKKTKQAKWIIFCQVTSVWIVDKSGKWLVSIDLWSNIGKFVARRASSFKGSRDEKVRETEQKVRREPKKGRSRRNGHEDGRGGWLMPGPLKGETKDKTTARVLISRRTGLAGQLASIKSRGSSSLIAFTGAFANSSYVHAPVRNEIKRHGQGRWIIIIIIIIVTLVVTAAVVVDVDEAGIGTSLARQWPYSRCSIEFVRRTKGHGSRNDSMFFRWEKLIFSSSSSFLFLLIFINTLYALADVPIPFLTYRRVGQLFRLDKLNFRNFTVWNRYRMLEKFYSSGILVLVLTINVSRILCIKDVILKFSQGLKLIEINNKLLRFHCIILFEINIFFINQSKIICLL